MRHPKLWACPTRSMVLISALAFSISVGWCQKPEGAAPPQKPLRERLLDRALKGDAEAQFDLGKNYEAGRIGLPRDFRQAQHWYREAANQGDPFAEASLALLFQFGKGVQRDYVEAYKWYERAASHLAGGDRDSIVEKRDSIASHLTATQMEEARRLAKEWKPAAKSEPEIRP